MLTLADGKVVKGMQACPLLKTRQPLQLDPAAMAVPMDKYHDLLKAAAVQSQPFIRNETINCPFLPPVLMTSSDSGASFGLHSGWNRGREGIRPRVEGGLRDS